LPEAHREARRRWAKLLRRIFEVDPLACPRCGQTQAHRLVHHRAYGYRPHPRAPAPHESRVSGCL